MTPSEAATLLGHIAAFDRRTIGEVDARAWAAALHDTPLDRDTLNAVARYFATPPEKPDARRWLEPHHVRTLRAEIRAERIPDGAFTYPALDRDETGAEFVQRRRAQIRAIADGRIEAEPIREITGGPHPSVTDTVARIGQIPEHLRAELAAAGIGAKRGQWPELAIPCPLHACRAEAWNPCRTTRGKRMQQGTHPSRRDAWKKTQDLYVVTDADPQEAS
ncbi:hypothetical protein OG455_41805 [Kitasatospora sp. NBC_01287]|uniref:zinc finger domain-containing protein n=1 Tax=Kitasatospora sp. NBC_01287 TaxID=2903573 RepID=UPI002250D71B|nr:hypothetical protein [Kitasatospora sp. NBC_01287]MCX4751728.1 hypothetical protein [Kitasatospora sp. NBC_01287]MCX4751980.1 hypothetical protein [Kitasatospora sp. NBC_01287]